MSRDDLTVRQRAVLFALLGEARQVANPELEQLIGVRLDGAERRDLNDRRLVESTRAGRAFAHELSDAGWRWCAQRAGGGARPAEGAAWSARTTASSPCSRATSTRPGSASPTSSAPEPEPQPEPSRAEAGSRRADLTACIEAGYRSLAASSGEFVSLRELRLRLPGRPRPDVDAALAALFTAQRINLIPQSNQRALSDADREAALRIGGECKHLISIE